MSKEQNIGKHSICDGLTKDKIVTNYGQFWGANEEINFYVVRIYKLRTICEGLYLLSE